MTQSSLLWSYIHHYENAKSPLNFNIATSFELMIAADMSTRWNSQPISESCMELLRALSKERGLKGKWPESQDGY
jgi:hypothetical protein